MTTTTPEQARELADYLLKAGPHERRNTSKVLHSLAQQVEALKEERDAFKADAELYRHLRDHFAKTATDAKAEFARLEPLTGARFDAAVRASMDAMGVEA